MSWTCVLLFCWTCYMLYLIANATGPTGYTVCITLGFIAWNMRYIYFFYVTSLFHAELDQESAISQLRGETQLAFATIKSK